MSSPPPSPKSSSTASSGEKVVATTATLTPPEQSSKPPTPQSLKSKATMSVTKKERSNSERISDEIEKAHAKFEMLQRRIKLLLDMTRGCNSSMVAFSENQIKEAHQYEMLLKDSPLEAIVGKAHYSGPSTPAISPSPSFEDGKKTSTPTTPVPTSSPKPTKGRPGGGLSPRTLSRKMMIDGSSSPSSSSPSASAHHDGTHPLDPVNVTKIIPEHDDFDHVDPTLGAVVRASRDLTTIYATKHDELVPTYIEKWADLISFKVKGRMTEYAKLADNWRHYEKKVRELRVDIDKAEDKNKKVKGKEYDKLERNEVKLEGATVAHDAYGETLILLLEEVTDRAWRDAYPMLVMRIKSHARYYSDHAKIFEKLASAADELSRIGTENGVSVGGRLRVINDKKPEEFYTGEREMVSMPKKKGSAKTKTTTTTTEDVPATAVET